MRSEKVKNDEKGRGKTEKEQEEKELRKRGKTDKIHKPDSHYECP